MAKTVEEINNEWGKAFIETLNENKAALVLAVGIDKDRKPYICITTDISKKDVKQICQQIIDKL